jgi:outer membrane receptor protein involved in Fe transport
MNQGLTRLSGILLAFLLAVPALLAQTTGSIRGTVSTGGTPLPGVTVEAKSPNLQGARTSVTDAEGHFNLTLLPPGSYTITTTLSGFAEKKQTLSLGLGAAATANFDLIAATSAEVTVTAQANVVETESSSIGQNTSSKVFEALPIGRNYASVVQLDAGVGTDGSDTRNTSITVYGSTGLENSYLVDGSNTTGVEYGSQGKTLNFEFIQEVEFKAGGYEAEFGHSTGGIVNVVTKSGGNQFHGDAFGYFNNASLQAQNKHVEQETASGIDLGFTKEDFGADIGGFILKDRLWFFGAYDRVDNSLDRQVTIGPTSGDTANVKTGGNLYSAKLTWHVNESSTVIGSVFGDPTNDTGAIGQLIGPATTYDGTVDVGGTDWGIRYEGIFGSNWLVTAQGGVHTENTNTIPGLGGNTLAYQDTTGPVVTAFGGFGGTDGNGQWAQKKFTRDSAVVTGSYLLSNHDIKAGVDWEKVTADVLRNFSGATAAEGGQLVQILAPLDGDTRPIYSHIFFASLNSVVEDPVSAPLIAHPEQDIYSLFAQDSWKVLPNLTVNAGVRWEKQLIKGASYSGDVPNVVEGPLQTYIDINHFSPRVGVSWDFLNDGRTKFFASYGDFVESIPMDMNIRSLNGERDATTFNFDPSSAVPDQELIDADYPTALKGAAANVIDPNISTEYLQEVVVGVEHQFGQWNLGIQGMYRSLRSVIEDTCVPVDVCDNYAFTNPGNSTVVPCPPDFTLPCYNGQALPRAARYFRGIQFTAQKQLSDHWMLNASYLYSTLRGNFDGSFRAIGGFNAKDPNITDDFDYPEFVVNSNGSLTLDRPHQAKLQAAYLFPFNLTVSASAYYLSGAPLSKIGWWDGYGGPELFLAPRGSEGRSPAIYELDMHLDYGLLLGPVTVHVLADVFNLLNKQQAVTIDQVWANQQADNESPTPTNAHYGQPNTYQQARTLRLGVRVSF